MASLGRLAIAILVVAMLYEVLARYVFNAPTLWAFDISYMLNGSIFILGAAFALQQDAHVRIDFLNLNFFPYQFLPLLIVDYSFFIPYYMTDNIINQQSNIFIFFNILRAFERVFSFQIV